MQQLPKIIPALSTCQIVSLTDGTRLEIDIMQPYESLVIIDYNELTPYRSKFPQYAYQKSAGEKRNIVAIWDRTYRSENVNPIKDIFDRLCFDTNLRSPHVLAFEWGNSIYTPAIVYGNINYQFNNYISGLPTYLKIDFTLALVDKSKLA